MAKNATKWPQMIAAVYNTFGTGDHSGDATTRRVIDRAVSWLVKGKALSPKLQSSIITNINQRTHFKAVDPGHPIKLTPDQIKYAKKTNPEWFGIEVSADVEDELFPSIPLPLPSHSPTFTLSFPDLSPPITLPLPDLYPTFPLCPHDLARDVAAYIAEKLEFLTSARPGDTSKEEKSKEEKRQDEKRSHEHMTWASPQQVVAQDLIMSDVHDGTEPAHMPGDSTHSAHGEEKATHRPAMTIWVKSATERSARLATWTSLAASTHSTSWTTIAPSTSFRRLPKATIGARW